MRNSTSIVASLGTVALLTFAGAAHGAFSNFGPDHSYDTDNSHLFWTWEQMAMGFVAGSTGNVSDIYLGVTGGPGALTVQLFAAEDDWNIGELLGTWTLPQLPPVGDAGHISVSDGPEVFEGGQYWLSVTGDPSQEGQLSWWLNPIGGTGPIMHNNQIIDPSGTQGAFAVVVPAPGALALLALTGLVVPRRHRS